MSRATINAANHRKRKLREAEGYRNIPQVPDDVLACGNVLTEEQERAGDMAIQAATWQLLERRREMGQRTNEDRREAVLPREYIRDAGNELIVRFA